MTVNPDAELGAVGAAISAEVRAGVTRPAPAFPIGLIALDLDGTLIDENLVLRPRTVAAIRAAREGGVAVSIVTGRMTTSALPFARQLGLVDPLVAYQGALIRAIPAAGGDARLGRILAHRPLAAEAARDVIAWSREVGLEPHVNHLERFVIQSDDPRAEDYSTFLGARAEMVGDLRAWLRRPVSKVISVAAASDPIPESILAEGRRRFAGRAAVTISHPRFLEFLAPGVSKLVGVRHLARRAGVPLGRVLSVGDQFNDLEMLAGVGHGAAMAGAPLGVRAAARYLAPPLADEGAAQLIEQLVLAAPAVAARNADALGRAHITALELDERPTNAARAARSDRTTGT
ncbi:MAG TPA: HAD-IIB family hydrolase [Patescibacteria group bacterium]|nr:HAD-IIB family hydrolase [Patescibacteria group bacterium]